MKLCPAQQPVTIIGTNYSDAEVLRLVEQHFTSPPPLLRLLIDRFGKMTDTQRPGGPALNLEEEVEETTHVGNCPGCGCGLTIVEE